jgi:uncharacterized membrane protein
MFAIWRVTAHVIAVVSVMAGVLTSNAIIAAIGIAIGMIMLISARQRYRVVTHDERTLEISRRAASAAFRASIIGLLALYMLNRYVYPFIEAMSGEVVGDWLGALAILMIYCHIGFYAYYRWRM